MNGYKKSGLPKSANRIEQKGKTKILGRKLSQHFLGQ